MKVCFLVGTLGRGGAEKQLIYMLRAARSAGIETRVLCLTKGEVYESEIKRLGVSIEWIGESKNRLARLFKIIRNLQKQPADIIQSSHFYTNIYAGIAGKFLKIPSIGAIRSDLTSEIKTHGFLGAWQIRLPDFLVANSKLATERAITHGVSPHKIAFVRNVIEIESNNFKKTEDEKSLLRILFAGRLERQKRPERFIHLAASLIEKFPARILKFQIAGDGSMRKELEKLADEYHFLSNALEFLGSCPDMDCIYRHADILVSTSDFEGTPNVVLEAMAHGLPVIATIVGGTPEILNEGRGLLVKTGDQRALEDAAEKLITDKNLRIRFGVAGQKYVKEAHSLESLQKCLVEIYGKLLEIPPTAFEIQYD